MEYPPGCVIVWGCDPESSHHYVYNDIIEAVEKGAKLIVIDPVKTKLAERAELWLRLRPGTDLALALSMINIIISESIYDKKFVDKWTVGFKELKRHVLEYPPETVEEVTWVDKEKITQAARLYALHGPACIHWGNGLDTNINSIQCSRSIAILRAITGNLGIPGGEVKWSNTKIREPGSIEFTCQNEISDEVRNRRLSMKDNLAPFIYYTLPQRVIKSVLDEDPYLIRAAYILGGNILSSYSHSQETYEALLKLDFLVVADMFMNPTAMMADIVLPVATYLEFDSIELSNHLPLASVQQKVAEVGESWSDLKIINELAKKMELPYFWDNEHQALDWALQEVGISFDEFRNIGIFTLCLIGVKTKSILSKGSMNFLKNP